MATSTGTASTSKTRLFKILCKWREIAGQQVAIYTIFRTASRKLSFTFLSTPQSPDPRCLSALCLASLRRHPGTYSRSFVPVDRSDRHDLSLFQIGLEVIQQALTWLEPFHVHWQVCFDPLPAPFFPNSTVG